MAHFYLLSHLCTQILAEAGYGGHLPVIPALGGYSKKSQKFMVIQVAVLKGRKKERIKENYVESLTSM